MEQLNRYANGKIYSIRSHQTDDIYIGSTCLPLYKRFYSHKSDYKLYLNEKKHYISSFDIIKYDDSYIELIEDFSCKTKQELARKEGEHIRANNCVNKFIAGRTKKESYEDNKQLIKNRLEKKKEQIKNQRKSFRENNKEHIFLQKKEYRETHKEQIKLKKAQDYLKRKALTNNMTSQSLDNQQDVQIPLDDSNQNLKTFAS